MSFDNSGPSMTEELNKTTSWEGGNQGYPRPHERGGWQGRGRGVGPGGRKRGPPEPDMGLFKRRNEDNFY